MTSSLLHTPLDVPMGGDDTIVGFPIRSRGCGPVPWMEGTVAVTRATSGLGLAAAGGFTGPGAAPAPAGSLTGLGAAPAPAGSSGRFWHDRRRRRTHLLPGPRVTEAERRRLWAEWMALNSTPRD